MASSKYSISAVNRITGKSRTTINKHIQQGKLSYELDEAGNKLIDAAELIRVYGNDYDFDVAERRHDESRGNGSKAGGGETEEGKRLQEQLDREITERTREREQSRQQIEHLQEALTRAQEGLNRTTLLLEDQSKRGGDWEQGLKLLEQRFTAQEERLQAELREIKESAMKRISGYKRALEAEKAKGFWKRLFAR